ISTGVRHEQENMSGVVVKDWTLRNNWSPRIGLSVDLSGNGRSKIYSHYGIYRSRLPNDAAAIALSSDASIRAADYFDADLVRPVPNGVLAAGTTAHYQTAGGAATDSIDPNAKLPSLSEYVVVIEREEAAHTTLGVRHSY